jgi:hypothetical protein
MARKSTFLPTRAIALLCGLSVFSLAAMDVAHAESGASISSSNDATTSQLSTTRQNAIAITDLNNELKVFSMSAAAYVFENVGSVPWNQINSTTPVAYAPFLLYAGATSTQCGFASGTGTAVPGFSTPTSITGTVTDQPMVNKITGGTWTAPTQYLPENWAPPLGGTYCAVAWLNQPAAQQFTLSTYYVAPNGAVSSTDNLTVTPTGMVYQAGQILATKPIANSEEMWEPMPSQVPASTGGTVSSAAGGLLTMSGTSVTSASTSSTSP